MADPKTQQADGAADQVKGKAKEAYGAVTDDEKARAEGRADQIKGKAKQKIGEVRDKARRKI